MRSKKVYLIISIVSLVIALAAIVAIGALLLSYRQAQQSYDQLAQLARAEAAATAPTQPPTEDTAPPETTEETEPTLPPVDIPIDFGFLKEQNEDIIGWILVDGTMIDYPVLYDTSGMLYYLKHNYAGTVTDFGSIFVLDENSDDFTDFNTVIYGHNMLNGSMFAQLHRFREKTFFDEHGLIVIYTPDRKLTYQVFAAYRTDNLNIIVNNDFSTEALREEYIQRIFEHTEYAYFKPEYPVTASDRIVTLSTCIRDANFRYVVQGVLISDEPGVFAPAQPASEDTNGS